MPKVQVVSETKYPDIGLAEFRFVDDGKKYRVLPKPGSYDKLERFLKYVKYVCPKTGALPWQYPKWQEYFEIDRLNAAGQVVKEPEKAQEQPPEAVQMALKLGSAPRVVLAYMRAEEAEKLYQEYWPSDRGKKVYDKSLDKYRNTGEGWIEKATKEILEDVRNWLQNEKKVRDPASLLPGIGTKISEGIS